MVNYNNALIYTIKTDTGIYVGSTTNFKDRKGCHKRCVYNENNKQYCCKVYRDIRQNDGEYIIEIFKMFPCNNNEELRIEENKIINQLNANLNQRNAYSTAEEKREYSKKNNVIKTVCECGCNTTLGHIARHRKTKRHNKLLKEKLLFSLLEKD